MIKQGGKWQAVDWTTALDYVSRGLDADQGRPRRAEHRRARGRAQHGRGAAPARQAGARARQREHRPPPAPQPTSRTSTACGRRPDARWLGTPIAALSKLQRVLVVGSFLRKDHPLFAQRIRQAARRGAQVHSVHALRRRLADADGAPHHAWRRAAGRRRWPTSPRRSALPTASTPPWPGERDRRGARRSRARCCPASARRCCSATPPRSIRKPARCLRWRNWIGEQTGATVGYLTEAANTVGAQLVGALPGNGGLDAQQMLRGAAEGAAAAATSSRRSMPPTRPLPPRRCAAPRWWSR